jgi:receptor protein-tyrosine kinase
MSRIHEALKRAEQEKATQNAPEGAESGERVATAQAVATAEPPESLQIGLALPPAMQASAMAASKKEFIPGVLKFEELWANCSRPQWHPDANFLVFSRGDALAPGAEQFRTLRSRLYRIRDSQPLQSILISSAIPAEGKTLTATNLAYAIVRQRGSRVLLVDADLRSPRMHELLGTRQSPGLADYLQGTATLLECIQRGPEDGLCFIPAGTHVTHPAELIASKRLKEFLEQMKPLFDWIIVDAPPALPVADASVIGTLCDGVLFVVRAGSTPSEASQKACQELQDSHVIGVVLNTVQEAEGYNSYYAYSGYGSSQSSSAGQ